MPKLPRPWKTLKSEEMFRSGFIKVRREECLLPTGNKMPGYYIFDLPNWVNVVPITAEKQILFIKQYRHASAELTLELPGGAIEGKESPKEAALRELQEETGYRPRQLILEKKQSPNPAIQSNVLYSYLAMDCEKVSEPKLDPYEEIQVVPLTLEEVKEKIKQGQISHSLILSTLLLNWRELEKRLGGESEA